MKIQALAPTRISLFGGGTDIPSFSDKYGGLVLSMAINLRQSITMYSDMDIYEVAGKNVFPYNADPTFYYKILQEYGINDMHQTKLTCKFDGIIESGLGSSASAAVALLGCIDKRLNLGLFRDQIANRAWELETQQIGLFGGKQDQYAASFGGINLLMFQKDGQVNISPLQQWRTREFLPSLVLVHTGIIRTKTKIQEQLRIVDDNQTIELQALKNTVIPAINMVNNLDLQGFGILMGLSWESKKLCNPQMTTSEIENIYQKGLAAGAWGGKLLGSGGGGYMLFCIDPNKRKDFIAKLGYAEVSFSPDYNGLEVRVLDE
jgi:D-glycero-alpha-D-manno-heptose-7-phosphate kinase